jgi:hypothetical protein
MIKPYFILPFIPIQLGIAVTDTVWVSMLSTGGTILIAFIGFLQWRKTHTIEAKKTNVDAADKFRDDIMVELNNVRQRMDSLMNVNASLIAEKATFQVQMGQQQTQIMDLNRRLDEAIRSRDMFEQRVLDLTRINTEQGKQIETLQSELIMLRTRLRELEKGTH